MTPERPGPLARQPLRSAPSDPARARGRASRRLRFWLSLFLLPVCLGLAQAQEAASSNPPAANPAAAPADRLAYEAAVRTLQGGFAEKAAADLAEFARLHPESPLLPEATLLEARARSQVGQLDEAAQLLTQRLESLGARKDQGLHLLGEVELRRQRFAQSAAAFHRLLAEFPASPLVLSSAFSEALAWFRTGDYSQVASLLSGTNSFARAAAAQPNEDVAVRGTLLLADALLRTGATTNALATLDRLTNRPLTPTQAWDREWLLASVQLASRQFEAALSGASNLFALATTAASPDLLARSYALRGDVLARAGRTAEAYGALTNNLSEGAPPEWRREAMLAVAELPLAGPQLEPTLRLFTALAAGPPGNPTSVGAQVASAELRLQQFFAARPPSQPPPTNALEEARALLRSAISNAPSPPLAGRAWFSLGWTDLANRQLPDATLAFARAAELLPPSHLQSLAILKLADCQQQAGLPGPALTNYLRVARGGDRTVVPGAALERALYQGALAALECGQPTTANELAGRAVVEFPNGEFRDDTRVLYGQTLARLDPPQRAREMLQSLADRLVNSPALPEIRLAVARSFLREGNWTNALQQLDDWTRAHANHPEIARTEFERAWAAFRSGDPPRAYGLFTNFLARFPDHPDAPQAQVWVGDYLFRTGNFVAAESSYQLVFQRTNWPVSRLTHEARLMAGRAAFSRQGYRDAKPYFLWLIERGPPAVTNSLIPPSLVAQAYFALGDCFLYEPVGDDKLSDAMTAFATVIDRFPQSHEALLARGKLAGCHLARAELDPATAMAAYTNAAQLYLDVISAPAADPAARSQAELGLGRVRELQAARASGDEAAAWLKEALGHHLNVFNAANLRPGETASPAWVHRAGIEAARLAEALGLREQAAGLYDALARLFPASATAFQQRATQLRSR